MRAMTEEQERMVHALFKKAGGSLIIVEVGYARLYGHLRRKPSAIELGDLFDAHREAIKNIVAKDPQLFEDIKRAFDRSACEHIAQCPLHKKE